MLHHLNAEFIYSRGRKMGIEHRFPGVMNSASIFFVQRLGGKIVSALAVKPFAWITPNESFDGTMVGLVWTTPSQRGKGLAKKNLLAARSAMLAENRDFMVLWTTQPDFYSGNGWQAADCGLYGTFETQSQRGIRETANPAVFDRIEVIRRRLVPSRASRYTDSDLPIPLCVGHLHAFIDANAYAVLGFNGDEAFVLDIEGEPISLAHLWTRLSATARKIHVNVAANGVNARFMTQIRVPLSPKPLAMWMPLSARAKNLDFSSIYIPFWDRI